MRNLKTVSIPWFFELMIVLYVLHTTVPIFGYLVPAAVHGATVVLLFLMLFIFDKSFGSNTLKALPIFSIKILSLLYLGSKLSVFELYSMIQLFLYPLLSLYLIQNADRKTLKTIIIIIGMSLVITSVTTYFGNQIYPQASRHLAAVFQSDESYMYGVYMMMNIGGFNFIYTLVLLVPLLIYVFRNKTAPRWITLAILAIYALTVFISEYTTALLSVVLTVVGLLLLGKSFGGRQVTLFLFGVLIAVLFLDNYIFPYFSNFTGIFGSEQIDSRMSELSEFSFGQSDYEGDLGSRYSFYMMSLDSFIKSPIWGSANAVLGGHSFIIDSLGCYGIIGIVALILLYRQLYKVFYKPFRGSGIYGYILFSYGLAILLAVLNPKDNLSILTFMIPLTATFFSKTEQRI